MARAGLPADGADLWRALEPVRQRRICVSHGEIDPGVCGAAVPVFERARVIGSLSVALPSAAMASGALDRATRLLVRAGYRIEAELDRATPKRRMARKRKKSAL